MTSSSPICTFVQEFAINTATFTGVNLLLWGTRTATWLNCSPMGMALSGAIQGVTLSLVHTVWDVRNTWIKTAITVAAVALGAFAAFLLSKPLTAYMGVITVKAMVVSAVLCFLIKIIGSCAYRRFFPPLHERINRMSKQKFCAFLKFLEEKKDPLEFWRSLSLRVRYTIWDRILRERTEIDDVLELVLRSLPITSTTKARKIKKLTSVEFQQLVDAITQNKCKEASFWKELSPEVQDAIWARSQKPFLLPITSEMQRSLQTLPPGLPKNTVEKIKRSCRAIYLVGLDAKKMMQRIDKGKPVSLKEFEITKRTFRKMKLWHERLPKNVSTQRAIQQLVSQWCKPAIRSIQLLLERLDLVKLKTYPKKLLQDMTKEEFHEFCKKLLNACQYKEAEATGILGFRAYSPGSTLEEDEERNILILLSDIFETIRFEIWKRMLTQENLQILNEFKYFFELKDCTPITKMSNRDFRALVNAINHAGDKKEPFWGFLQPNVQNTIWGIDQMDMEGKSLLPMPKQAQFQFCYASNGTLSPRLLEEVRQWFCKCYLIKLMIEEIKDNYYDSSEESAKELQEQCDALNLLLKDLPQKISTKTEEEKQELEAFCTKIKSLFYAR